MVGLSLSYLLQLIDMLQWAVRQSIEVEMQFISVERIIAYTRLEPEPPRQTDRRPPEDWPDRGAIEFRDMSLTYPGSEAPVLKNISFTIQPGEKIGVVGRTGAGKSSLLTALFRLTEAHPPGCILIDGIPISELGVHDLRSRLSIIPQVPVLFKGSLRFNLDPFQNYSDHELWQALEAAELKETVERMPDKLDTQITEDGKNLSAGERQLISLCRAILRNARIVIMDEATANVDLATDKRIQRAIHKQFRHATVLTIAHRLDTVIGIMAVLNEQQKTEPETGAEHNDDTGDDRIAAYGSDRILVLDHGQVREFGPPEELLCITDSPTTPDGQGWLRRMVLNTGEAGERAIRWCENRKIHGK
jgi:ATP-binding cassette subfamily C (CFTR/MRP) protein 4